MALVLARALSAGPSPPAWWRIASGARLRQSRGHRTERGLPAGRASLRVCIQSNGSQLDPGPRPPGQIGRKVELGVALGGHGHAHPFNLPLASSLAAGGATVGCVTSYRHRLRRRGPGRRADADSDAGTSPGSRSDAQKLVRYTRCRVYTGGLHQLQGLTGKVQAL